MSPAFALGVLLDEERASAGELLTRVKRLESSAADILLVSDHADGPWEPFGLVSHLVARTTKRVGTYVASAPMRHPVQVARATATVAALSNGRFRLGVGAGWRASDAGAVGQPHDGAHRRRLLTEHTTLLVALLSGDPVSFDGEFYSCHLEDGVPPAASTELLVGASGPRMVDIAAKVADWVGFTPPLDPMANGMHASSGLGLTDLHRRLRQLDEFHGRRIRRSLLVPVVRFGDERSLVDVMSRATGIELADLSTSPYIVLGDERRVVERLRDLAESCELDEIVLPERTLKRCPGLLEMLRGA